MAFKKPAVIPELDQIIDLEKVKKQILEQENPSNFLRAYINNYRYQVRSRRQRDILHELEEWYQQLADIMIAQTRAHNAKARLDMARDPKAIALRKANNLLTLEQSVAEKEYKISFYKKKKEALEQPPDEPKTIAQKKVEKFREKQELENALDEEKWNLYYQLDDEERQQITKLKKKYESLERDSFLDEEEREQRLQDLTEEIKSVYSAKRSKFWEDF